MTTQRQQWRSRLGFILAASGSAIGLGNIVFFGANAYKFGAGAFYLPYLTALVVVGIPLMILEFGLGRWSVASFPAALGRVGGGWAEGLGWWGILNASIITMYYVTILGWVAGMWWSALAGTLWEPSVALPAFGLANGAIPNPVASFFALVSSYVNIVGVAVVWVINWLMLVRGTRSLEAGLRVMLPLMWLFMLALVVRGITLNGGVHGIYLLFTPNPAALGNQEVWRGAFSQIFFTLSLGFGIMSTYASYLPKNSDHTANAIVVSTLNCGFEMIAGMAIFSLLFANAMAPKASTLSMMFFIVPKGIASLPFGVAAFGTMFFTLLLLAGLTSSVSLIEAVVAALVDRVGLSRRRALLLTCGVGFAGSLLFATPTVINPSLSDNGTLGLTLLDLLDHYAFSYGLLFVGLVECLLIGWVLPVNRLRALVNETSVVALGPWFDALVKYVIPIILIALLALGGAEELRKDSLYGSEWDVGPLTWLPIAALTFWAAVPAAGAWYLTRTARIRSPRGEPGAIT